MQMRRRKGRTTAKFILYMNKRVSSVRVHPDGYRGRAIETDTPDLQAQALLELMWTAIPEEVVKLAGRRLGLHEDRFLERLQLAVIRGRQHET